MQKCREDCHLHTINVYLTTKAKKKKQSSQFGMHQTSETNSWEVNNIGEEQKWACMGQRCIIVNVISVCY